MLLITCCWPVLILALHAFSIDHNHTVQAAQDAYKSLTATTPSAVAVTVRPTIKPRRPNSVRPSALTVRPTIKPRRGLTKRPTSIKPSARPTIKPRRPPTKRPNSVQPSVRNMRPTIKPTRLPLPPPSIDYSKYLFLGDSLLMYWTCFSPGMSAVKPSTAAQCLSYMMTYFRTPSNLLVNCRGLSTPYCNSSFQKTFPGAINLAIDGYTIQKVTERVSNHVAIRQLSLGSNATNYITHIVLAVGTNNIVAGTPMEMYIPLYSTLLKSIHSKFPHAQILLLAIAPSISLQLNFNKIRTGINSLMNARFANNPAFPYVKYGDISEFFNVNGVLDRAAFVDSVHFSSKGYEYFYNGIKYYIEKYFAK